jgi:hypothetical protein
MPPPMMNLSKMFNAFFVLNMLLMIVTIVPVVESQWRQLLKS